MVALAGAVVPMGTATAHVGSRVFSVFELPTADLPDLHDGTLEDWEDVLGPSLDHRDFASLHAGDQVIEEPVPQEQIAFDVYLAWHAASQRLYVGVNRYDEAFEPPRIPEAPGPSLNATAGNCCFSYDNLSVIVDGDHSGGAYYLPRSGDPDFSQVQARAVDNREAQLYEMVAEAHGERLIHTPFYGPVWAMDPPYLEAGAFRYGDAPSLSGYEMAATPWDWLDEDPLNSEQSHLEPGRIIGLQILIYDFDETYDWARYIGIGARFGLYTIAGVNTLTADECVDALLVPCDVEGCSQPDAGSAVAPSSWGRVKAAVRR